MSKQALYHYAENLSQVQRATFTDTTGKQRGLGENGRDLLVFLCNAANEKQGWTFYMSYQYIAEETNIHISTVKRLMAGLEQLGWITRTGQLIRHQGRGAPQVEFCLTFYPPALELMRTSSPTSRPTSSHVATDNLAKPNATKGGDEKTETETEPQPEPERFTGVNLGGGENELTEKGGDLLTELLAQEDYTGVRNYQAVRAKKRRDYLPIVREWEQVQPPGNAVEWCRHKLLGTQPTTPQAVHEYNPPRWARKDDQQPCEHGCDGFGVFVYTLNGKEIGLSDCVCNGGDISKKEPTHLRVVS
jgi:DNA-binding Lrp family transcriptional regulator